MLHTLFLGVLIGWGLAIPVGPVTLEITRRNLTNGFWYGLAVGFGASSADLVFIILLTTGALITLQHPEILRVIAVLGSLVLFWFGWQALTAKPLHDTQQVSKTSLWKCFAYGYAMATLSPFNILFWASLTTQIASISLGNPHAIYPLSIGILLGIWSWLLTLNIFLHVTRHKISQRIIHLFNITGGLILWGFALYGLIHALN